jgi:NAD+ diphosphatase
MAEFKHTYAGNPYDRGEPLRRSEETVASMQADASSRFLTFHNLNVATQDDALAWLAQPEASALQANQTILLGVHEGVAHFAIDVKEPPAQLEFTDCRTIAASLATEDTGIVAQARSQLDWHRRNPFCAQCGAPSRAERGGQVRRCTSCERHIFPRTDPVAIMLIVDEPGGNRCLLGKSQGRMAQSNFYSALAGFLDQGESLEEAVRREVWEEAGIRVGDVRYHSSQPWPFPSQLMIGCHGIATTTDISIDEVEMADVSWFTRDEARAALEQDNPDLRVPGAMAIAHHLIRSWVYGEVEI